MVPAESPLGNSPITCVQSIDSSLILNGLLATYFKGFLASILGVLVVPEFGKTPDDATSLVQTMGPDGTGIYVDPNASNHVALITASTPQDTLVSAAFIAAGILATVAPWLGLTQLISYLATAVIPIKQTHAERLRAGASKLQGKRAGPRGQVGWDTNRPEANDDAAPTPAAERVSHSRCTRAGRDRSRDEESRR